MVTRMGQCQDRSVGRIQRSLFRTPRLVRIDEHHNLEVQSWDCRRSLGLESPSEPSPSAWFQHHLGTICRHIVLSRYPAPLTRVAPEFSHYSGSSCCLMREEPCDLNVIGNLAQSAFGTNTASSGGIAIAFAVCITALIWSLELRTQTVPLPASLVEVTCTSVLACSTENRGSVKQDSPSTALPWGLPLLLVLASLVLCCLCCLLSAGYIWACYRSSTPPFPDRGSSSSPCGRGTSEAVSLRILWK